jgi:hypothetical protein
LTKEQELQKQVGKYQEFPGQVKKFKSWLEFCRFEAQASRDRVGYLQGFSGVSTKILEKEYSSVMKVLENDLKVREGDFQLAEKYVTKELLPILKESLAAMA